jgi:hypothetical protein
MYNVAIDFRFKSSKEYSVVHKVHFQYNTRNKAKIQCVIVIPKPNDAFQEERTIKYCSSQCHYWTDVITVAAYCTCSEKLGGPK